MNPKSISLAMIRQIAAHATCTVCGHHFHINDFQVLGRRENVWAMRVNCRECHTHALFFAVLSEGVAHPLYSDLEPKEWDRFKGCGAISVDDVVAFHKYISEYKGDFSEILDEPLPPE
jgi:hypothetical protein